MRESIIYDTSAPVKPDAERSLTFWEKVLDNPVFRKTMVILFLAILWELAARYINKPMMIPTFIDTLEALRFSLVTPNEENNLLPYLAGTMKALIVGYVIGVVIATIVTVFSVNTRIGEDFQHTVTAICTPLPAVAVAPVALLAFGLSFNTVLFVVAWATVFPVALSMYLAFKSINPVIINAGRNLGLKGIRFTFLIKIPETLPTIYAGLRNGFSNGFRALVALEMVIGAATGSGGLGWFIMQGKNQIDAPMVFAGMVATMAIGLIVEFLFGFIEKHTIKKYGMMN